MKTLYEARIVDSESNTLLRVIGAYLTEEQAAKEAEEHIERCYSGEEKFYTEYVIKKVKRK